MADNSKYLGVNFNNLRKALYLLYFGVDNGNCNNFESPKYKYIIPMQGNFDSPLQGDSAKDTFIMFWIESDRSITQDDLQEYSDDGASRQKCVADILVRTVGKEAEDMIKALRHLIKRDGVTEIWSGVCNAEKLEYTSPIVPARVNYFGKNSEVAFDIRFRLYYDETISTGWKPLTGIDLHIKEDIEVEGSIENN